MLKSHQFPPVKGYSAAPTAITGDIPGEGAVSLSIKYSYSGFIHHV